ncbi:hypothetical protein, variant 2 [Aphanomyces astaci]|nr:hypothetical protein, variant 2 [Aphanomyces astaci]ETV70898.1 hypothetical protein, variant 2 [Aphanomyces astaci]|eukprot:XP_009839560.1 hypothetical protein, variant 2 [Aphanomyces astaci]
MLATYEAIEIATKGSGIHVDDSTIQQPKVNRLAKTRDTRYPFLAYATVCSEGSSLSTCSALHQLVHTGVEHATLHAAMANPTLEMADRLGETARAKWKQVHVDSTGHRMAFATALRDRVHSLLRWLRHTSLKTADAAPALDVCLPSPLEMLASTPDVDDVAGGGGPIPSTIDDDVARYRDWASHERFNIDQAHAMQVHNAEREWGAYHAYLTAQVTAELASCDSMDNVHVAAKKRTLVRNIFASAMETGEQRKLDAMRHLEMQHRDLHIQIDAKELEFKLVVLVREQATAEFHRLDRWIHTSISTLQDAARGSSWVSDTSPLPSWLVDIAQGAPTPPRPLPALQKQLSIHRTKPSSFGPSSRQSRHRLPTGTSSSMPTLSR